MSLFAAALVTVFLTGVWAQADWLNGRATFYGNEWWLWNIHEGSCGFGYLCPEEGTGWDVAALPDVHWAYAGSCGRCYEVSCNPTYFQDGYGETLDRSYMCYDPSASAVVTITDTCPCNYATNFYSNKRWCCGDMDHLDISIWTFEKLAPARYGVIGLKYREVPCDYKPQNPAPEIADPFPPTPIPEGTVCPKGRFPLKDNWQQVQAEFRVKAAIAGAGAYANAPALDITAAINQINGVEEAAVIGQDDLDETLILRNGLQDGWQSVSFSGESNVVDGAGMSGGSALCTKLQAGGVTTLIGTPGFSNQKSSMEFWVQQQNGNTLALDFNLAGLSGVQCQPVHVTDLVAGEEMNGFTKYSTDLAQFGCGAVDSSQLDSLVLQNTQPYEQFVCVDELKIRG